MLHEYLERASSTFYVINYVINRQIFPGITSLYSNLFIPACPKMYGCLTLSIRFLTLELQKKHVPYISDCFDMIDYELPD